MQSCPDSWSIHCARWSAANVFLSLPLVHLQAHFVIRSRDSLVCTFRFTVSNNDDEGDEGGRKPIESSSFRKVLISACASLGFYSLSLATYSSLASFLRSSEKRICQSFLFSSLPSKRKSSYWRQRAIKCSTIGTKKPIT
jgi:hypothetical protein